MTTTATKLVFADEVGSRIAGFTVRSATGVELCHTIEQLEAIGATAWATSIELLIWLSRTPEFWDKAPPAPNSRSGTGRPSRCEK